MRPVLLDFSNLGGVVVFSSSELNMVASGQDSGHEASFAREGGHASDHDRRLTEEVRERRVEMNGTIAVLPVSCMYTEREGVLACAR